jgi:hypothetical protein
MGFVNASSHPDSLVSHGICGECINNLTFQNGVSYQDYIDSLSAPVLLLVVHADTYLITKQVNAKASAVLQKEPREIVQHLAGNVFECAHARLPEGCGRTVHCSGCTIRRAVMDTYRTGIPQSMVPATLKRNRSDRSERVDLFVTTVKTGEMVVLRIEELSAAPDL